MKMDILEYSRFTKYKLIIFDLDDTLYPERDYLFAAYDSIAKLVADRSGSNERVYSEYLKNTFINGGRSNLFDSFIHEFNLSNTVSIQEMLLILRTNSCELSLYRKAKDLLDYLQKESVMFVIFTNGNLTQQRNKIACLKLKENYPSVDVYYAAEYESKPSPVGIYAILRDYNVDSKKALVVGDSATDHGAAKAAGIDYLDSHFLHN